MTASATVLSATVPCPFCATLNRIDLTRLAAGPKCGSCKRPLHLDRPIHAGEDSFDKIIAATSVPILVDFYADWCGPCKIVAPVVDDLAHAHAGRIVVLKVDSDQAPHLSQRFDIRSIPTLMVFRNGTVAARHTGIAQRPQLEKLVGVA